MRWHVFQFSVAGILGSACSNAEALTGALVPSEHRCLTRCSLTRAALWATRAGGAALFEVFEEARL